MDDDDDDDNDNYYDDYDDDDYEDADNNTIFHSKNFENTNLLSTKAQNVIGGRSMSISNAKSVNSQEKKRGGGGGGIKQS